MMTKRVSVVLLNYNGHSETIPCIESLFKSVYPIEEIVIVDNNSTDNSIEYLTAWLGGKSDYIYKFDNECLPLEEKPVSYCMYENSAREMNMIRKNEARKLSSDITIIKNYANDGFSAGNNVGIKYLLKRKSEFIWLLNNDTVITCNSLYQMIKLYESSSNRRTIIGSCLYYNDRRNEIQAYGGGRVNFLTGKSYSLKTPGNVDYITGASLLIPSFGFSEIGYLDEKYFMYWEDTDFSVRAKKIKWDIKVAGNSIVYHKHNVSTERENQKCNKFRDVSTAKGAVRFFFKHAGIFALVPVFFRISAALIKRVRKLSILGFWSIIIGVMIKKK
ncbi:MAG: glycosyltransferase family 2 protein [Spirochaetes bacterium]|nr:glycosyltransferase family 2 protein [Spirochaetota bacterium]